jgi:hypothetical protein
MNNFAKTTLVLSLLAGIPACDPKAGGNTWDGTVLAGRGGAGGGAEGGAAGGGDGSAGRASDDGSAGASGAAGAVGTTVADAGASDDAAAPAPAAAFLGGWRYFEGTVSLTCDDGTTPSGTPEGVVTFLPGDAPDHVTEMDDQGCEIPCVVSGNTAVSISSASCPDEQEFVASLTYTISNGVLREQAAGRVVHEGAGCLFTADSMLSHH